jgi:hypothetical protein
MSSAQAEGQSCGQIDAFRGKETGAFMAEDYTFAPVIQAFSISD